MTDLKSLEKLKLAEFLPYRLSVLSNTVSKQIADRYQSEFGVSLWQWRVMAVLGEVPGLSASEIAERTAMDKVAVSRAVSGLIELGHIKREAVQDDGRRSLLSLTPSGQDVYDKIVPIALSHDAKLSGALSERDIAELHRLLELVSEQVSPDRPLW